MSLVRAEARGTATRWLARWWSVLPGESDIGIVGWPLRCRLWWAIWESIGHIGEPVESPNDGFELVDAVPQGLSVGLFSRMSLGEGE